VLSLRFSIASRVGAHQTDTWEVALIAAGVDGAQNDRARHVLTRALGTSVTVEADVWELDARPGDHFLLCSDGVTGALDDESLTSLLHEGPGRQSAAGRVVSAAISAGATAIVADVIASPGPLPHDRISRRSAHGPLGFIDGMLRRCPIPTQRADRR